MKKSYILIITLFVLFVGCQPEKIPEEYVFRNAHEAYLGSLEQAGLDKTALGRDWKKMSVQALNNPVIIDLPYYEEFHLDPAIPGSIGYRFEGKRGHRIELEIDFIADDSALIFIDLFREISKETAVWKPVASADSSNYDLQFEPRKDNYYIIRIQPELLRGGKFSVKIIEKPVLKFPVKGAKRQDIGSFFNDPRPGYRRHHGIDIFADRHTPVIAPVRSRVRRVGESEVGGRHVWLSDSLRGANYYFAHLQEISAIQDEWVSPGDTIGTVGNTGNARTTPPHLHFGIYIRREGPVDPLVYVLPTDTVPDRISGPVLELNSLMLTNNTADIEYYLTGNGRYDSLLAENSVVRLLGRQGKYYRIELNNSLISTILAKDLLAAGPK